MDELKENKEYGRDSSIEILRISAMLMIVICHFATHGGFVFSNETIKWYLENRQWWETIISGEYQKYYEKMYGDRERVSAE